MNTEDLENLQKLKESGALSEEEFKNCKEKILNDTQQPEAPAAQKSFLHNDKLMIVLGVIAFIVSFLYAIVDEEVLTCEDFEEDLISVVNKGLKESGENDTAIYADDYSEVSYDEENQKRYCHAIVKFASTEQLWVDYFIKKTKNGDYWIETEGFYEVETEEE